MAETESINFPETPLEEIISTLPSKPGVYRFYNKNKELLYVGKAKDLKKRVASYFGSKVANHKTKVLVSKVRYLIYTIVSSELDALLLENNLIKNHQPRYNIQLRDDKTFPYLVLSRETFPRFYKTRKVNPEWGTYFGPYASVTAMNTMLEFLNHTFNIRTCRLSLQEQSIQKGKFKVCLEYHLKNCMGPCEGFQSAREYLKGVDSAVEILKGNIQPVKTALIQQMNEAAKALKYEDAQLLKHKLERLERFQARSVVAKPSLGELLVFTVLDDETYAYVNYLKLNKGTIIHTENLRVQKKLDESATEVLETILPQLLDARKEKAMEVLTNADPKPHVPGLSMIKPKIGDKQKLIELSLKNLVSFKTEYLEPKKEKKKSIPEPILSLQKGLYLKVPPLHIECFDNSNIQGSSPVASMVCFKNGIPSKKDYRKFNIKTVEGPNDFDSMEEIVFRRYQRVLEEKLPLPDLIVIDGGKGQLNAARKSLEKLDLYGKVALVSIAKRLEEIYVPDDEIAIHMSKRSSGLKLLQQLRNEAHRFAITFHRAKRSKNVFGQEIKSISGLGEATVKKLFLEFKTWNKILSASEEDLIHIIGKSKASLITNYKAKKKEP
jgi:excinuclease ABC subunit C